MIPSGKWRGVYWYLRFPGDESPLDLDSSRAYPIEATIQVTDGRLTGTMRDLRRVKETPTTQEYEEVKDHLSWIERRKMRKVLRATPTLVSFSELPEESNLAGEVGVGKITFTKTYRGKSAYGWRGEKHENRIHHDPAPVCYSGEIDPSSRRITGTWAIVEAHGTTRGKFWLDFVSADVSE